MIFCDLNPPNPLTRRHKVIDSIVPRNNIRIRHRSTTGHTILRQDSTGGYSPQQQKFGPNEANQKKPVHAKAIDTVESLSSVINLMGQTDLSTGRKRPSRNLNTAQQVIASIQENSHPFTEELKHATVVEGLEKKLRNRIYQTRYKNKKDKIESVIQTNISKLQGQIEILEARCNGSFGLPATPTFWAIAAEYVRYFNYYASSPATLQPTVSEYLHGIMAPDVIVGSKFGVEAQLENWKLFALYFGGIQLKLRGMNMPTSDTLVAHTMINVTITSNTLRRVFPHLNSDGCGGTKGGSWSPLATKMLDQKLVMRGSVVFGRDSATDKVVRVQFQADMMTPMIKLLGNLRSVSCVFDKARVTPDCRFA